MATKMGPNFCDLLHKGVESLRDHRRVSPESAVARAQTKGACNPKLLLSGVGLGCLHALLRISTKQTNSVCHDNNWPRGVTVSTLDFESSDRGSNPREALAFFSYYKLVLRFLEQNWEKTFLSKNKDPNMLAGNPDSNLGL